MAQRYISLYEEALAQFTKNAQQANLDRKGQELLAEFLRQRASPEETKQAAESLQVDSQKKWGSKKVGDVTIPSAWIDKIMGNINHFVAAGNTLMVGAPESVGMAWFAVKLTLSAIQSNYELYSFFGSGLADISEIMIIISHYDRLYDEREKAKEAWKPSGVVEKLFRDLKSAYEAVLDFSYAIKCHLTAGTLGRIKHGFKDFFGTSMDKFKGKLSTISELKRKIVEGSQAAFQDKTLTQLEGVSGVLADVSTTVNDIKEFQAVQDQWQKESTARLNTILQSLDDIKASTKRKTPWDYALDTFQTNRKALGHLEQTTKPLDDAIESIHPGTCLWIFEHYKFNQWQSSENSAMLRIFGQEGTGKSTVLAAVVDRLSAQADSDEVLLYLNCGASETTGSGEQHFTADSICHTFLYRLYGLAAEGQEDVALLEACNDVFKNPKSKKASQFATKVKASKEESLPDFVEAFAQISQLLKRNVVLVLDGVSNNLPKKEQEDLVEELEGLVNFSVTDPDAGSRIRILVGCASSTVFADGGDEDPRSIDIEYWVQDDISTVLKAALEDTPGLSPAEREEAEKAIVSKAGSRFRYVTEVAISWIREPFARPLSKRLEALPGGLTDVYAEALRKMKSNYVGLLRTGLTWSLLCPESGHPTGREIMDAFYGTYDSIPEGKPAEEDEEPGFPQISRLELDQLRDASGPFLKAYTSQYAEQHFYVPEKPQVEEFCFNSAKFSDDEEHTHDAVCPRCKSEISQKARLSINEKDEHLRMAITCLRHLNHPLFQKRAGFSTQTGSQEDSAGEEESVAEAGGEGGDGDDKQPALNEEEPATEVEEGQPTEAKAEEAVGQEDSGYDTDDSCDDEIAEEMGYNRNPTGNEVDDLDNSQEGRVRYEITYWTHHVRAAEDLWTPEERADSDLWKELIAEFDKFVSNTEVFNRWQESYPGYLRTIFGNNSEPWKPLHVTAYFGLTSLAEHLLNGGADLNELSRKHNALQAAGTKAESPAMLKLLLEKGADPNAQSPPVWPAFYMWMKQDSSFETVKLLLDHGADPKTADDQGWSSLHYCAWYGSDEKVVDLLIEKGADINARESVGETPLHILLSRRDIPKEMLKSFLRNNADVNAEDEASVRPLQMASIYNEVHNLNMILSLGVAEIDDRDQDGDTALHQAAVNGHGEVIQALLDAGADPAVRNNHNIVALHSSAIRDNGKECVRVLLEWDKDHHNVGLNHPDNHNRTPFFYSCRAQDAEVSASILDALIANKLPLSEINGLTTSGRTPLRQAADHGFDGVVAKLIQLASEKDDFASLHINTQDKKRGMAPLQRAARSGHIACVRLLLDPRLNTDVALKDESGKTALVLAYREWALASDRSSFEEIIELLIERDPDAARHDAELIVTIAANGSTRLLKQLWRLKADLNMRDQYGWTPLEMARKFSQKKAEEFLRQQDAWTGMLPSRWGTSFPSTTPSGARSLSEDGTSVTHLSGERVCVSTDRPLPGGLEQYYFEITLKEIPLVDGLVVQQKENPEIAIGFCTLGGAAIQFPGWDPKPTAPKAKSWGYHADDAGMYSSDVPDWEEAQLPSQYKYDVGDTVGCGVDLGAHEIWFTRNGEKIPKTFTGVDGRLLPLIGLHANVHATANFGTEPFVWKGSAFADGVAAAAADGDGEKDGEETSSDAGSGSGSGTFVEVLSGDGLVPGGAAVTAKVGIAVSTEAIVEGVKALEV
ncbi:ankyrin repeat-containing domain protein [Apodospora peruviana]|uniref:Ankyrin repeat-containing domain protein n=1 Tax=Apodospora peruviana TaxID=516989 RepID=A0AAE0I1Q8_9PEZI|nr:ankyrin repeat-containing domain protein [Apodospora peruviana]